MTASPVISAHPYWRWQELCVVRGARSSRKNCSQEEFDALWGSPHAVPLAEFVVEDLARLAERKVVRSVCEWAEERGERATPDPAPAVIETPVYRKEVGLWEHQKYFVNFGLL